jgi:hypothetical protein
LTVAALGLWPIGPVQASPPSPAASQPSPPAAAATPLPPAPASFPASPQASSAPPQPPPCELLATISGEKICKGALFPNAENQAEQAMAKQPEQVEGRLYRAIWMNALIHKFGKTAIEPTAAEETSYRDHFTKSMASSNEADKKTLAMLQDYLARRAFKPEDKTKIEGLEQTVQASVKIYQQGIDHGGAMPEQFRFITDIAERELSHDMLESWKGDKTLYDAYKGGLYASNQGVLPLDAYKTFTAWIEKDGNLTIADPAYKNVLEDTLAAQEKRSSKLDPADPLAKNFFSSPEWQFTLSNNDDRQEQVKAWLESMAQDKPEKSDSAPPATTP